MSEKSLHHLTADIVAAYCANNAVAAQDLPLVIGTVHAALRSLGAPAQPEAAPRTPAVPVKKSVRADRITCLVCGYEGKMLKRHLEAAHGLTPGEYRASWGLPADYPMVAPAYAKVRSALAKAAGLGTKASRRTTATAA